MNLIKSEQQTHSEQQSEHLSEHLQTAPQAEANTTNGKNARAHVCNFFIFNLTNKIYFLHTRIKNSVRSVRFQYSCGFHLFAQVFALLFALGFAVRFGKKSLKNGVVA